MPIYHLIPYSNAEADWSRSIYKGLVTVRATSENEARHVAAIALGKAKRVVPGAATTTSPWRDESAVHCEVVKDPRFPVEGPSALLDPANLAS